MTRELAATYRRRARRLRALAHTLDTTPAMSLEMHAGIDVWFGPRPDACREQLTAAQRAVRHETIDLRRTASAFDRRADELDAAALDV